MNSRPHLASLVSAHALTLDRPPFCVVEGLSFVLSEGHWTWIHGGNGTGKSTILLAVAGLLSPRHGKVVFSSATSGRTMSARDMVSFWDHRAALYDFLSVAEHWNLWKASACTDFLPTDRILRAWINKPQRLASQLSQGERQRLSFTRILLESRPVWLLDEPLIHLDSLGENLFKHALRRHLKNNGTAMAASHRPISDLPPPNEIALSLLPNSQGTEA